MSKRNFNGGGGQGAYVGQKGWNPRGDNGFHINNPDGHTPRNGTGGGIGRGGPWVSDWQDGHNRGNGGGKGANGTTPTPLTNMNKCSTEADITIKKEVDQNRWLLMEGVGKSVFMWDKINVCQGQHLKKGFVSTSYEQDQTVL